MKILITGGAGFIGSHTADLLIDKENEVAIIDNLSTGRRENINPKARFYQEDLTNFNNIKKILHEFQPEIVYHFAAQVNLRKSIENPLFDANINILPTLNLLELSKDLNIKHFIFSSTGGAIYGEADEIPTSEEYREYPFSPYGCAKLAIEKYIHSYYKNYGLKYTILRYSNVYGPRQNPDGEAGVIAIFLNNMFSGKNPTIFCGIQTRDFVYAKDVAQANLLALNDKKSDVYNVGTGMETDITDIFSRLNKYFKGRFDPKYQEMKKGEQKRSCLSYKKIRESLNWEPATNLDKGLDKTYRWFVKEKSLK